MTKIEGGSPLRGHVRPPGDKSISHRALILSALAEGESQIFGLSDGEDVRHTAAALAAMGAEISLPDDLGSPEAEVRVLGGRLREPSETLYLGNSGTSMRRDTVTNLARRALYLGNSGTSMRLLAGVCAAHPMNVILDGDESLRSRPMGRIAEPLRLMGATVAKASDDHTADAATADSQVSSNPASRARQQMTESKSTAADSQDRSKLASRAAPAKAVPQPLTAPIAITGGNLSGIDYALPIASAQVKGAILLAGLRARGETIVREFLPSRAHTEEMLAECGADIEVARGGEFHQTTRLRPSRLQPHVWHIPADPSQAAFWIVAALCTPGSEIVAENVYLGPGREGFVDVLLRMGGKVEFAPRDSSEASGNASDRVSGRLSEVVAGRAARHASGNASDRTSGSASEAIAGKTSGNVAGSIPGSPSRSIKAQTSNLTATDIGTQEIPRLIDEIPVLAIAATHAEGTTRFHGIGELRTKESDRAASICAMLQALGGQAEADGDTLIVQGTGGLRPGRVDAAGDHRIAMSAAVAAMAMPAGSEVAISGWEAVATSYPRFLADAASLKN